MVPFPPQRLPPDLNKGEGPRPDLARSSERPFCLTHGETSESRAAQSDWTAPQHQTHRLVSRLRIAVRSDCRHAALMRSRILEGQQLTGRSPSLQHRSSNHRIQDIRERWARSDQPDFESF